MGLPRLAQPAWSTRNHYPVHSAGFNPTRPEPSVLDTRTSSLYHAASPERQALQQGNAVRCDEHQSWRSRCNFLVQNVVYQQATRRRRPGSWTDSGKLGGNAGAAIVCAVEATRHNRGAQCKYTILSIFAPSPLSAMARAEKPRSSRRCWRSRG